MECLLTDHILFTPDFTRLSFFFHFGFYLELIDDMLGQV